MPEPVSCGLVLLAAGASRRMGRSKQLLPVDGEPLLRRAARQALGAPVYPVIVVLGHEAENIGPCLDGLAVSRTVNEGWAEGLGSSVRCGVRAALEAEPSLANLIIALADQPGVTAAHFARLIALRQECGKEIVASSAGGAPVPPVLFAARWFPGLLALQGDSGARALLEEQRQSLALAPLGAADDLDTPEDYARHVSKGGA